MQTYYDVFHRTWWRREANGHLEPEIGKRHYLQRHVTEEDALEIARQWNAKHAPGELSDKAEIEEV